MAFADPLYRMLAALLDCTVDEVRAMPKSEPMPQLEGKTIRHTLQTLGTQWGRQMMGEEIWANTCVREALWLIQSGVSVVIDDCRFHNEYKLLRDAGAKFVRLSREDMPEQVNPGHESEADWPHFPVDAAVLNPSDGVKNWSALAGKAILVALEARG